MKNYVLRDNIYIDPSRDENFSYSDGDAVQNYILEEISRASDLSTGSKELFNGIKDWPSLYHLSQKRADLLRPLEARLREKKILEIGCGCGAITRYLGELDCQVTALEGSLQRATITQQRCRDLPTVKVVCDNFSDFSSSGKYDVITLIGVLEYANLYIKGENPVLEMLNRVKEFLEPGGVLILAIENKLGLKYWAGAPEDHTGKAYFGIENRYDSSTAVTFGRNELQSLLVNSGFPCNEFFYPFPDYKLPDTLVTEKGMRQENFDVHALLLENFEYIQSEYYSNNFSTTLAGRELERNGLLSHYANSFLVVSGLSPQPDFIPANILAVKYNSTRKKEYQKESTFLLKTDNEIQVQRHLIHPGLQAPDAPVKNLLIDESYFRGTLILYEAIEIISKKGWTLQELLEWAKKYHQVIMKFAYEKDGEWWLDGKYIDLTPFNIVFTGENEFKIFDQEWICPEQIPLGYVFFRGLIYSLGNISFFHLPAPDVPVDILELSVELYKRFFPFRPEILELYRDKEIQYFSGIGLGKYIPFTNANLKIRREAILEKKLPNMEQIQKLEQTIEWYKRTYEERGLLGIMKEKITAKFGK